MHRLYGESSGENPHIPRCELALTIAIKSNQKSVAEILQFAAMRQAFAFLSNLQLDPPSTRIQTLARVKTSIHDFPLKPNHSPKMLPHKMKATHATSVNFKFYPKCFDQFQEYEILFELLQMPLISSGIDHCSIMYAILINNNRAILPI